MLKKKFIIMAAMIAMLFSANLYSQELLKNSDWSTLNGSKPADWRFINYGGKSVVKLTTEKLNAQPVAVIESKQIDGRGYLGQNRKIAIPVGKNVIFSGCYRTANVALGPKGMLRVEIKYNKDSQDKEFSKRYQAILLKPSEKWQKFESVKTLDVPVKKFSALFMLYKGTGELYFSNLSLKIVESVSKINPQEKYIWREAEAINKSLLLSTWGKKQPNYFSGRGGIYVEKEPVKWHFRIKSEVNEQTLLPTTRNYFVWLRMYGYMDRPAIAVTFNRKQISSFKTKPNEQVDSNGKYAGPGKYYWQQAGSFRSSGGSGNLTLTPQGRMLLDAIVITTDSKYAPMQYEARKVALKNFFTDLKTAHTIKSEYKVYGISDQITTPLNFLYYGKIVKIPGNKKPAIMHISLPANIKIKNISSHWAGKTWNRPTRWGDKYLTWKQTGTEVIDGIKQLKYEIYLYCLSLRYTLFIQADKDTLQRDSKFSCKYFLEYKGKKQLVETVPLHTVVMKPTTTFKTILIGPAGGNAAAFYEEFPDIAANMAFSGLNVINAWHIKPNISEQRWQQFRKQCMQHKIAILGELSPFYGAFRVKDPQYQAVNLNGKRDATRPALYLENNNPAFRKNLDYLTKQGQQGVTGMVLDDEHFNQKIDEFDYNPLTKALFKQYIAKHGLSYVDPVVIVKDKTKYAAQYKVWVDFKCDRMVERYRQYRQAYLKGFAEAPSSTTFGRKLFVAQIFKNNSPVESKTNSYWDYKKLATVCDYISPMIYTYGGIKDSALIGDITEMYNNYIGRNVIAPTLLCEHSGSGGIDLAQKKMFKYQTIEALMQQSKLIMFWKGAAVYNPINLQYISEAIRWTAPYEKIILNGNEYKGAVSPQQWVRIKGLKLDNHILLYVANYRNLQSKTATINFKSPIKSVLEIGTGQELINNNNSFTVSFKSDRGKLFLITQ
ncbi:MAG: hypothetical protein L3J71_07820 [Victivallaceae bacterium]|nr:hypothetical protein [Victivallaceae bacterium]